MKTTSHSIGVLVGLAGLLSFSAGLWAFARPLPPSRRRIWRSMPRRRLPNR